MRNSWDLQHSGNFGFGFEHDPVFAENYQSPDQLALVHSSPSEMIVAYPLVNAAPGNLPMDVLRFPSDFDLAAAVNKRRSREVGLPPLSQNTQYLTSVSDYSERTRILALDGERLAYDDAVLLQWLVNAEQQMLLGTDNHPVFETSLEDTACTLRRLPNGQISITEVSRQHVQALGSWIRSLIGEHPASSIALCIETPLRCASRYFLTETVKGTELRRPGKDSEVTAFLLINATGYNLGLWSPSCGLFNEYGFLAPDDLRRGGSTLTQEAADDLKPKTPNRSDGERRVQEYIRKAFDQLLLQISPEKLANLQLRNHVQVVWAADMGLSEIAASIAVECSLKTGLEFLPLGVPADDAVAGGLLLGSYSFGNDSVHGALNLPQVNLARDILVLADTEAIGRRSEEEARLQTRRNKAAMTMLAAPIIVISIFLAFAASLLFSQLATTWRESRADARMAELKPALERRRSYEANLKWYQEFISEVSQLRRQQPAGIGLLYELNSNYPFSVDPSFYVSDLKLSPIGDVEMKGLARNKDAVASFLKSLEFTGGSESGTRLFSNLAYEVQEITSPSAISGQAKLPTITGSTLGTTIAAPGVVVWKINGNYAPVAKFAPKPPAAAPTGGPVQPAPAQPPVQVKPVS